MIQKKTIIEVLKKIRVYGLLRKVMNFISYQRYCMKNIITKIKAKEQREYIHADNPLVSIVIPLYNTKPMFFHQLMRSIISQTYSNWEICLCDGSTNNITKKMITQYQKKLGDKIKVVYPGKNLGISGNTNEAIKLSSGDFIGFIDHDDTLSVDALHEMVVAINDNPEADFLYSDEDKINYFGNFRSEAFFKPAFSPDKLRSVNYICHFTVVSKKLLDNVGYCRSEFDGSQDYDLILRLTESAHTIIHIPRILYHWRKHPLSTSSSITSKSYVIDAGRRAINDHLKRVELNGYVEPTENNMYRVTYSINGNPKISIIILNKNCVAILRQCIDSILVKTTYTNFEIIIVENNSSEEDIFEYYKEIDDLPNIRIKTFNKKFNFSEACNFGAEDSDSQYFLFLNNDTTIISCDWLERMLEHAQRESIGIVGAKLLYQNRTLQHGGVIIGVGGIACHSFTNSGEHDTGYYKSLITIHNVSAVTGACMMIRKDIFENIGKFDEEYPVALSDIDICLKVISAGYFIVWTPYAVLYHLESFTRGGYDNNEKISEHEKEIEIFKSKWQHILDTGDPFYNPNLSKIGWKSYQVDAFNRNFELRNSTRNQHWD